MTDALLDLSSKLETIQNDLRYLASLPEGLRAKYQPITLHEAEGLIRQLGKMVERWLTYPEPDRRQQGERRQGDRRRLVGPDNGASA